MKKSGSPTSNGGDAIGMESDVRNVWVDHVTLEASGGESEGFDGLFDMKSGTQYVTLSYSILRNSGRGGLVGSSESDLSNGFVTFHHNLYENIDSRAPLLRGGIGHMYNNHYVSLNESGINSRAGAKAKVDNNYFEDSKDVLGTFYTDAAGNLAGQRQHLRQRHMVGAQGSDYNPAGPERHVDDERFDPLRLPASTPPSCVPSVVAATAGANRGLKVSDGSCTPQNPEPTPDEPRADAHAHHTGTDTHADGAAERPEPQHRRRRRRLEQGGGHELRQRDRRVDRARTGRRLRRPGACPSSGTDPGRCRRSSSAKPREPSATSARGGSSTTAPARCSPRAPGPAP